MSRSPAPECKVLLFVKLKGSARLALPLKGEQLQAEIQTSIIAYCLGIKPETAESPV
jgi:hypothetical protein